MAWGAPPDLSAVGHLAVRKFYEETIVKGGQYFFEMDIDRIVVDDDTIVTEGNMRSLYYGADAAKRGLPADDASGFYLLAVRLLIVWPNATVAATLLTLSSRSTASSATGGHDPESQSPRCQS